MQRILLTVAAMISLAFVSTLRAAQSPIELLLEKPDAWFATDEGRTTIANIVSWQNANGGWYKAYDFTRPRPASKPATEGGIPGDGNAEWNTVSTFDNGATHTEIRLLCRAYTQTKNADLLKPIERGLEFVFESQYENGGWPQRYPLQDNYGRHITYNDDVMLDVLNLLEDIVERTPEFEFLSDDVRMRAEEAVRRGIECILNTQVRIDGKLTVWGQQHDEITLAPAGARSYELPSLCSTESANVVMFLMKFPEPTPRMIEAVHAAAEWFESHKLTGFRVEREYDKQYPSGYEIRLIPDENAPPTWARFYDLVEQKPFFCDRDGVPKRSIDEIGHERRTKYAWYNGRGNEVLKRYAKWKLEHPKP